MEGSLVSLKLVNLKLAELDSKQSICQESIKGLEEVLGNTYISSYIPLEKFTVLESRVNFANAFEHLIEEIYKKYEVEPEAMRRQAVAVYEALCQFKAFLLSSQFGTSPLFQFLNNPSTSMMLDPEDNMKPMSEMPISYVFGDKFFLFARHYSEYVEKLIKDAETTGNKISYNQEYLDRLKAVSVNTDANIDKPTFSIGYFLLLNTNCLECMDSIPDINFTVNDLVNLVTPANITEKITLLDQNIEKINLIVEQLSGDKGYDRKDYVKMLGTKMALDAYNTITNSPVFYNIIEAINLGHSCDIWRLK